MAASVRDLSAATLSKRMSCTATYTKVTHSELNEVQVQCRFTSTETVRTIRDGEPRAATSTFTQFLGSDDRSFCVGPLETRGTFRDGEPRTATSIFTQLLCSVFVAVVFLCFLQVQCCLRPRRPYGLLGTGTPGRPPRLTHSFWAQAWFKAISNHHYYYSLASRKGLSGR